MGGLAAMYAWRSVYWSEQVSSRTRALLMIDWIVRCVSLVVLFCQAADVMSSQWCLGTGPFPSLILRAKRACRREKDTMQDCRLAFLVTTLRDIRDFTRTHILLDSQKGIAARMRQWKRMYMSCK